MRWRRKVEIADEDSVTKSEAYDELARRFRAELSRYKLELYRQLQSVEKLDQLGGYELVRAVADDRKRSVKIGESLVWPTNEQPDAFNVYRDHSEWRTYIDEVILLLEEEKAQRSHAAWCAGRSCDASSRAGSVVKHRARSR